MSLRVDEVSNEAGTGPVVLTGQEAAKAWANVDGLGTPSIRSSLNASSITDTATGRQSVNLTTAMSTTTDMMATPAGTLQVGVNSNGVLCNVENNGSDPSWTVSSIPIATQSDLTTLFDVPYFGVSVLGDLA